MPARRAAARKGTNVAQLVPDAAKVLALGQAHEGEEAGDYDRRAKELVKRNPGGRRRNRVAELNPLQHLEPLSNDRGKDAATPNDNSAGPNEVVVASLNGHGRQGQQRSERRTCKDTNLLLYELLGDAVASRE